jgi:hypothetical protein
MSRDFVLKIESSKWKVEMRVTSLRIVHYSSAEGDFIIHYSLENQKDRSEERSLIISLIQRRERRDP